MHLHIIVIIFYSSLLVQKWQVNAHINRSSLSNLVNLPHCDRHLQGEHGGYSQTRQYGNKLIVERLLKKCSGMVRPANKMKDANFSQKNPIFTYIAQSKEQAMTKLNAYVDILTHSYMKLNSQTLGEKFDEIGEEIMTKFDTNLEEMFNKTGEVRTSEEYEIRKYRGELITTISQLFLKVYLKHLKHLHDKYIQDFRQFIEADIQNRGDLNIDASGKVSSLLKEFQENAMQAIYLGADSATWRMFAGEMLNILSVSLQNTVQSIQNNVRNMLKSSKREQRLMEQMRMLQQHIQNMQQTKQSLPLTAALAFKPLNTNMNLSGVFSDGKLSLQMAAVSDESAPLLGPNGFVHGVPPGNMGVSFNLNI